MTSAYLTEKQLLIWDLHRLGRTQADIGREIDATRQAAHNALKISLGKVEAALRHTAEASMIETRHVDPKNGILLGTMPSNDSRVIITFSKRYGMHTWHYEEPTCQGCRWTKRCTERLFNEAEERKIELGEDERKLPPSRLANFIFSRLIPELEA